MIRTWLFGLGCGGVLLSGGCQPEPRGVASPTPAAATEQPARSSGHDDHGRSMELGTAVAGPWNLVVSRNEGELKPGGEALIDCRVSGGSEPVSAVRFWIGTAEAQGALKARGDAVGPTQAASWHAHVEVPASFDTALHKLWVEVEGSSGAKQVAGFDLKH